MAMKKLILLLLTISVCIFAINCATTDPPCPKVNPDAPVVTDVDGQQDIDSPEGVTDGNVVEIDEETIEITRPEVPYDAASLLEVVYFDFDSSELKPRSKEDLKMMAQDLLQSPQSRVIVEGHCDERGTEEYNIGLGERRAKAVKYYLMLLGIETERIDIISYGEAMPIDPRQENTAWEKNRRAEVKQIP